MTNHDDFPAGIGKPARRALLNAGYNGLVDLSKLTDSQLLALHGVGPKAVDVIRAALAARRAAPLKK